MARLGRRYSLQDLENSQADGYLLHSIDSSVDSKVETLWRRYPTEYERYNSNIEDEGNGILQ